MRHLLRRSLLLLLVALPASGKEADCADKAECWPEGSAMHTGLLLVERMKGTEKVLEKKHAELVALVSSATIADGTVRTDERLIAALTKQQAAWLTYRWEECELIGSLKGAGGSWPSTHARRCASNMTDQRIRRVKSAISCITLIPANERLFEQARCLQQLAPLANQ